MSQSEIFRLLMLNIMATIVFIPSGIVLITKGEKPDKNLGSFFLALGIIFFICFIYRILQYNNIL